MTQRDLLRLLQRAVGGAFRVRPLEPESGFLALLDPVCRHELPGGAAPAVAGFRAAHAVNIGGSPASHAPDAAGGRRGASPAAYADGASGADRARALTADEAQADAALKAAEEAGFAVVRLPGRSPRARIGAPLLLAPWGSDAGAGVRAHRNAGVQADEDTDPCAGADADARAAAGAAEAGLVWSLSLHRAAPDGLIPSPEWDDVPLALAAQRLAALPRRAALRGRAAALRDLRRVADALRAHRAADLARRALTPADPVRRRLAAAALRLLACLPAR